MDRNACGICHKTALRKRYNDILLSRLSPLGRGLDFDRVCIASRGLRVREQREAQNQTVSKSTRDGKALGEAKAKELLGVVQLL